MWLDWVSWNMLIDVNLLLAVVAGVVFGALAMFVLMRSRLLESEGVSVTNDRA